MITLIRRILVCFKTVKLHVMYSTQLMLVIVRFLWGCSHFIS